MAVAGVRTVGRVDGRSVGAADLVGPDGTRASVLTYGAVLQRLLLPARAGIVPVVLGFETLDEYVADRNFIGRIVGRYANRIADGRFVLDGRRVQLTCNERGRTHLHGGSGGFWSRVWRFVEVGPARATLELVSPDGDEGYPGEVTARCTYELAAPATLRVDLSATTTAPTLVNLACHSYFTLDPDGTTRDLDLAVEADRYTPVDDALIPLGSIDRVDDTPFDFRQRRPIGSHSVPLDINFVLRDPSGPTSAATLSSPRTGLALAMRTNQPGLQVYDGHLLPTTRNGLRAYAGFCLEGQVPPDSPNRPHFPSAVLRPGERYHHRTEYSFGPL